MVDAVVDACVMRSAGETDFWESVNARSALDAIFSAEVDVIVDLGLLAEWDKHASAYSLKWRASLETKGRIVFVELNECAFDAFNLSLKYMDSSNAMCAKKDSHLVISALNFKAIIISNENSSRGVFHRLSFFLDALFEVRWVKPSSHILLGRVMRREIPAPNFWSLAHDPAYEAQG